MSILELVNELVEKGALITDLYSAGKMDHDQYMAATHAYKEAYEAIIVAVIRLDQVIVAVRQAAPEN